MTTYCTLRQDESGTLYLTDTAGRVRTGIEAHAAGSGRALLTGADTDTHLDWQPAATRIDDDGNMFLPGRPVAVLENGHIEVYDAECNAAARRLFGLPPAS